MQVYGQRQLSADRDSGQTTSIPGIDSGKKIQPKEEVFGRISLRTSGQKLRSGPPILETKKKQAFWNGHPARTSMRKLRSEKLRADFPFPIDTQSTVAKLHLKFSFLSGTKKEPKPKLLSLDIFWWGRGLPREGVGAKKFGMSLETQGIKLCWRDIPGFCRDIPEAPEKFEK